jgi:hypothetical protein
VRVGPIDAVNRLLDGIPRTRFGSLGREVPAFRSCGVAGFHLAVIVTVATGAARGRSLAVLAALCASCGLSFFVYALARKIVSGRERLVLLEHVWFALACATAVLLLAGEPPLGYLDAVASGLAFFLAAGRVGCTLVGCCHGLPSSVGICYGAHHARDGFPAEWTGVRLFPVPLVEAAALVAIGAGTVLFALRAADGAALSFFLLAYAVARFGLEALRGDVRPHLLGISQPRWMAVAEAAVAVALSERASAHRWAVALLALLAAAWIVRAAVASTSGRRARATRPPHLRELREAAAGPAPGAVPVRPAGRLAAIRSSLGFAIASSPGERGAVVSLSLPGAAVDLPLLCDVATASFPELDPSSALLSPGGVILFEVPGGLRDAPPPPPRELAARLHAQVARARQREGELAAAELEPAPAPGEGRPAAAPVRSLPARELAPRASYFARGAPGSGSRGAD